METIKAWAVCLVICTIAGVIVHTLSPKDSNHKAVQTMICVFLLCALLSPFFTGKGVRLNLPELDTGNVSERLQTIENNMNILLERQAKQRIEQAVTAALQAEAVDSGQIDVDTDILEDGRILINEIRLTVPAEFAAKKGALQAYITQQTGCPVTVVTEEESP